MTPIASMVLEMIEQKVDPQVIARAVQAAEEALFIVSVPRNSAEFRIDQRKEKDRLRKRNSAENSGIPRNSADASLSKSNSIEEREDGAAEFRGNWRPSEPDWTEAVSKLGEAGATSELTKFRELDRGIPGGRGPRWRVWVQRAVDYQAKNKPPPAPELPTVQSPTFDWEAVVRTYHKTGYWSPQAGPDPESPACKCPREILEKHAILAMRTTG